MIPGYQTFVFSNGKNVVGGFNHDSGKFHGLHQFCSILGIEDFGKYNLILLSYETLSVNNVSVFDDNFVEVLFGGTPISPGMYISVVNRLSIIFSSAIKLIYLS